MEHPKEQTGNERPSSKSLHELMNLLMKLNAKLKEKISPLDKSKEAGQEKLDVVIIIMNNLEEKQRPVKNSRPMKQGPSKGDWIQSLCEEIERGAERRKKS